MTVYIVQQLQTNDYCGIGSGNEIIGDLKVIALVSE